MTVDDDDRVFKALADRHRRRMLDVIRREPGIAVGALCSHFAMSRIGAMKHLKVLEVAALVISREEGRVRRLYVNAVPIQRIQTRWTTDFGAHMAGALNALKRQLDRKGRRSHP